MENPLVAVVHSDLYLVDERFGRSNRTAWGNVAAKRPTAGLVYPLSSQAPKEIRRDVFE
jgi:hypothetical protein